MFMGGTLLLAWLERLIRADAVELPGVAGRHVAARLFPIVVNKCLLDLVAGDGPGTELAQVGGGGGMR